MRCIICGSVAHYFFSKTYVDEPFKTFMKEIGDVQYYKCELCGFTLSKTHYDMNPEKWEKLNHDYHTYMEELNKQTKGKGRNPPPYYEIAFLIKVLARSRLINEKSILDFAGGYGTLSNILINYFDIILPLYDPYVQQNTRQIYVDKSDLRKYKTVVNTALFEHITSREPLDEINSLVDDGGCMIIHTVVAENIPNDVDWFYIKNIPVHCAFHTNKSMGLLMDQWGYAASVYCPAAKSWAIFKEESDDLFHKVEKINTEFQTEYLIAKSSFVDYWKGF